VEQSVAEAHAEAKRMMEDAKAEKECAEILSRAEEELQRMEKGAAAHKERAIAYVLDAVAGVEEG
jgi:F0F1-type ATP synthase membrane subunit b/b'